MGRVRAKVNLRGGKSWVDRLMKAREREEVLWKKRRRGKKVSIVTLQDRKEFKRGKKRGNELSL